MFICPRTAIRSFIFPECRLHLLGPPPSGDSPLNLDHGRVEELRPQFPSLDEDAKSRFNQSVLVLSFFYGSIQLLFWRL